MPSGQAAETQSEGSFHPTTNISTSFHNRNAPTCRKNFACKVVQKITITYSGFQNFDKNPNNSYLFKTEKCRMYQMKGHFKVFSKLVIYHSCRIQRRRKMLPNVQSPYLKVTQGTLKNPEIFVICKSSFL